MNNRDLSLDIEVTAVELERDAKFLSCAPVAELRRNQKEIESARELLNDALARVERQREAA